MSLIGINIKKIRKVKGISQTEFAKLFGLTRANIGSYEEQRAEPKLDIILKIADFYKINISKLVTKELTVNEISNFNLISDFDTSKNKLNTGTKYIPEELLKQFPKQKENLSFLKSLPRIVFPFIDNKKNRLAIYNKGNELYFNNNGFLHGDILFLEKLLEFTENNFFLGIVIDNKSINKGIVEIKDSSFLITPTNPNYKQKKIAINSSASAWKIKGCYSENVLINDFLIAKIIAMEK